jgi:hypothetical protein
VTEQDACHGHMSVFAAGSNVAVRTAAAGHVRLYEDTKQAHWIEAVV